jgi:hypothetical protein
MTVQVLGCLIVSATLLLAGPGLAQTGSAPATNASLGGSLTGEARAAYDAAKLLLEDGDASGALAKFRRAYEISHDARLLWNMAVCEKERRHYASAARLVTQYLNEDGARMSAENRQDAEATQAALRGFYSELTLEGLPADARVSVDGVHVATAPLEGPLPIDLGQRDILIELMGFEPVHLKLEVPGATPITQKVSLVPRKNSANLAVNAGAKDIIALDGKVVGSGEWRDSVPAGTHVVRVSNPGKRPYINELRLEVGMSRSLDVVLQDEGGSKPLWPWIAGGAAILVGVGIGGYLLLKPDETSPGPSGALGRVYLPLGF